MVDKPAPRWRTRVYERTIIHPAVAAILSGRGYEFRQEVIMPDYGRADFVGHDKNGKCLIVEAKAMCAEFGQAIMQVCDYRAQFDPDADVAIAVPAETIFQRARDVCIKRRIELIEVDVPILKSQLGNGRRSKYCHQHRFDLYADNPADVELHEYLVQLGDKNQASAWIRQALMLALEHERERA